MHTSKYNVILGGDDGTVVFYNTVTDGILRLSKQLYSIVEANKDEIDRLSEVHPDLYHAMRKFGFIVEETDEFEAVVNHMKVELEDDTSFLLTINPTLNCNLNCWYCYENHQGEKVMKDDVLQRILLFVGKKVSEPQLEVFHLGFFGGEPFLYFKKRVLPIIELSAKSCGLNNKQLELSFTTNGTLLSPSIVDSLSNILNRYKQRTTPSFQITLDGNKEYHDKTRKRHVRGFDEGTYDMIIANINLILFSGWKVDLRFNYTNDNIDTFLDVMDDLDHIPQVYKKHLNIDLQPVWQNKSNSATEKKVNDFFNTLRQDKYRVVVRKQYGRGFCYADKKNSCIINFDGLVYKCTARDFIPELCEGILTSEGDIEYNELHIKRVQVQSLDLCQDCIIFPICHRGCSQDMLEFGNNNTRCLRNYDEYQKMEVIKGRIRSLSYKADYNN